MRNILNKMTKINLTFYLTIIFNNNFTTYLHITRAFGSTTEAELSFTYKKTMRQIFINSLIISGITDNNNCRIFEDKTFDI